MPWIAATTGFADASIAAIISMSGRPLGALPNSEMSAPAMKVRPAQMSTIAFAAGSAAASAMRAAMLSRRAAESAFTGGLFTVRTAIPSVTARLVMVSASATWSLPDACLLPEV